MHCALRAEFPVLGGAEQLGVQGYCALAVLCGFPTCRTCTAFLGSQSAVSSKQPSLLPAEPLSRGGPEGAVLVLVLATGKTVFLGRKMCKLAVL